MIEILQSSLRELHESRSSDVSQNDDRISCRWFGRKGNHVGFDLSLIPALYDKIYWNYEHLVELWGSEIKLKKLLRNFTDQSYWYIEYVLKYYFKWVLMGFNGFWYYFYPRFHDEYDFYNFSVYLCLDVIWKRVFPSIGWPDDWSGGRWYWFQMY